MSGVPFSLEKFNAREQLLSADLVRGQVLSSRDRQDVLAAASRSLDVNINGEPVASLQLLSQIGTPIYGVDVSPTWSPGAGYTVTIGAGQGYLYYPALGGLTTDDSAYLVARWAAASVTFANPDATNPRIDMVIATPASVDSDAQARTVLVDPVTRAISTNTINKTTNPVATVSIVTGTAAVSPVVPALPAGAIPLFYVWLPASAASAARISPCRASWRRAPYPFSGQSGILSGMGLKWDLTSDSVAASAAMIAKGFHRICIDGEVMEFVANLDSTVGNNVATDSSHNPFGSAAPAGWHKPYYIYACGGRHLPLPAFNPTDEAAHNGSGLSPITLVESTTPPALSTRQATATLTVNGQTVPVAATLYVGIGFVFANTTHRLACMMSELMTQIPVSDPTKNTLSHTMGGTGTESIGTLLSIPSVSDRVGLASLAISTTAKLAIPILPDDGTAAAAAAGWNGGGFSTVTMETGLGSTPFNAFAVGELVIPQGNGKLWALATTGDTVKVWVTGYNHRVGHMGMHVNP